MKSINFIMILLLIVSSVNLFAAEGHDVHWSYQGETGPEKWGDLSEEFETCKEGKAQSPIDLKNANPGTMPDLEFYYQDTPLMMINNGHTLKIDCKSENFLKFGDKQYKLLQFHFHSPSENTVNGEPMDMEVHLVHRDADGNLAVVAVFYKKGEADPLLAKLFEHFPKDVGQKVEKPDIMVNAKDLLPKSGSYYHFRGSLTTPPCSEGVMWFVMKEPLPVSEEQVSLFFDTIKANARPTQPLNGRKLFLIESGEIVIQDPANLRSKNEIKKKPQQKTDSNKLDTHKKKAPDKSAQAETSGSSTVLWIVIIAGILLLILVIVMITRKKKE